MQEKLHKQHRFPMAIIDIAVAWHTVGGLPYRAVSEKLRSSGIDVSHKTVFEWVQKFGPVVTKKFKKKMNGSSSNRYTVDQSYVKVNGEWKYVFCAIDEDGDPINVVAKNRKDPNSAKALLKKTMEKYNRQQSTH